MNLYIKRLAEAFDFNSVKKQDKKINAVDNTLQYIIIPKIDKREKLSQHDYDILTKFAGIYKVSDYNELKDLIEYFTEQFGNECNLNWIDVSNVTNMSSMFQSSEFNGDISKWDVSNVTDMEFMFYNSKFNADISKWDVSNVTNMNSMFQSSKFNRDISKWDVSKVAYMGYMFYYSKFNRDISKWDVSSVKNMEAMFGYSKFNKNISKWNVRNVTNKFWMFRECPIKAEYKPKFK